MQARSANLANFHHRDIETELLRADGGHVAAGAPTNKHDGECLSVARGRLHTCHSCAFLLSWAFARECRTENPAVSGLKYTTPGPVFRAAAHETTDHRAT